MARSICEVTGLSILVLGLTWWALSEAHDHAVKANPIPLAAAVSQEPPSIMLPGK